ncbi:hypothetical protein CAPTEDRAFT_190092 [Capitella teleta]|uniref:Peptidase M20 domain-containing protein 2 n=1 Tax=Capitella teleta TaxID=283909 RepID=R7TE65_CAPTE|nr:hypothetical protein CAPTEDRAFT_190092 [Capitella teleta]|eukprot:ELT89752.1 hypothetical protein CAPTEDRAFT_190092 [Capitella teleta]
MTSKESLKQAANDAIDQCADTLLQINRDIWNNPEVAFAEVHAHHILTDFFEGRGFSNVRSSYVLPTGFRAEYGSSERGSNIAVVCEYDALPGIGHACGHNLIAEVGAGAAIGIKAAMDIAKTGGHHLGQLTVMGTPAEEGCGGKIDFINANAWRDVDLALMAHPWAMNTTDTSGFLARSRVSVKYHGKASHAAGSPWEGVNALDAAVLAYSAISTLRQQCKPTCMMHGVIVNGGTKPNIIPELSELDFYFRASSMKDLEELQLKATGCFQGAAAATGCSLEMIWNPKPYANVLSNPVLIGLYEKNAASLGVEMDNSKQGIPVGSTDMGNVSQLIPSIHPFFAIGTKAANHTREFTQAAGTIEAHRCAMQQAKVLAMVAIDVYCDKELASTVAESFQEQLTE